MAVETRANACQGTNGVTLSTSNTGGPNQFTAASSTGSGTTLTFSSTHAHSGTTSVASSLPASVAATTAWDWGSLESDTQKFIRFYMWIDAFPTAATRVAAFIGSASLRSSLQLQTNGTLRTLTSAGGQIAVMTETVPLSQWVRIEFEVTGISGTTGNVAARMYSGANLEGWTPDTGAALFNAAQTVGGNIDDCRFGQSSSTTMTSQWTAYYDDIAESNQSQPGPLNGCFIVVVADMQPGAGVNAPPDVVSAQIEALSPTPNYILMPGDEANDGTTAQYGFWQTMYGGVQAVTYPVPGNHDWGNVPGTGTLTNYDTEFGTQGGSGTTPPHFISFNTSNGWHILGFDSGEQWIGSVNNPSTTYTAVLNDLTANAGMPTIAFWHHPRWSDGTDTTDPGGTNDTTVVSDIWNLLRDHNCDIVFNGHCHSYQRFPKFGKTGTADARGIREFVVGTGGSGLFTLNSTQRSEVNSYQASAYDQLNSQWFGYLKLFLTPTTYSWQFISQNAGGSQNPGAILDSGGPITANVALPATGSGLLMTAFP